MDENLNNETPATVAYDATIAAPKYDEAVANRDVNALKQGAKDNIDTPASSLFLNAAKIIERNNKEFQNLVAPIDKNGGAATPEGRMQIVAQFESTADRPQWGTALLKYVMGDKDGAVKQITGGDIKTKITYDNDGNQIEEKYNELGEPLSYVDRKTGRMMSKEEYAQRAGGISSFANTLFGLTEQERRKQNLQTEQAENAQTNHWFSMSQNHAKLWKENLDILSKMKTDLPPELYNQVIANVTSSAGSSSLASKSKSIIGQLTEAATKGDGFKISDTLAADLGRKGDLLQVKGDRIVSKDGSFNKSINELKSQQSTESQNAEQTKNMAQTRDSIMTAAKLGKMSNEDAQRLLYVMDNSQRIGRETQEAIDKFGKPAFISVPTVSSMFDKQAQMIAQGLQGMHNAEQMMVYKGYRDNALQGYRQANQLPTSGEIAAQYSKTSGFKELQNIYSNEIGNVLSKSYVAPKAAPAKKAAKAGPVPAPQQAGPKAPPAKKSLADIAAGR